jgi:hypothetical protein
MRNTCDNGFNQLDELHKDDKQSRSKKRNRSLLTIMRLTNVLGNC